MIYHETDSGVLHCGDCTDILSTISDMSVDLTVTSPPYDNLRDYKGYTFNFETTAENLFRITKMGGVVVWVVGDATINGTETGTSFKQALGFMEIGFNLHDTMIYQKDTISYPDKNRYQSQFEYMFVLSRGKPKTINLLKMKSQYRADNKLVTDRQKDGSTKAKRVISNSSERIRGNVWLYNVGFKKSATAKYVFGHPAIFPERLAADHILSWSREGDTILDPFMGSGTTAAMAIRYRRKYIGVEMSPDYCEIAKRRIDAELEQMTIGEIT